jgi:glycosyltransferase involved in cell wall biosynthesis
VSYSPQDRGARVSLDDFGKERRSRIRIAVVAEDLRLPLDEGAKKTSFSLARALAGAGAEVSVFTRYENPLLTGARSLPGNKALIGCQFGRQLRAWKPDVVLYLPASSGTVGALIRTAMLQAQSFGKPVAMMNLQYRKLPGLARYLRLPRYVRIVFTQSHATGALLRSAGCRTVVLPGAVDTGIFRPVCREEKARLRARHRLPAAGTVVLHVGHCNRDRNVMVLARVAQAGFLPVFVASTSTTRDEGLLAELSRAGVTVVTHFADNIEEFYQMADCYLFPVVSATSSIDAPLSVLEAMACNLPVVTTPFGALPGMFPPGNGLYYGESEAELLARLNEAMQARGCRTSELVCPYSWENLASGVVQALDEAIRP